jgi:Spy/CpxP family protein refolding chaperone
MMRTVLAALAAALAVAQPAFAQSPYAGLQARPVKALSDQQIADLKAGRGMGLALPAELNGYPGPSHLLELADQIGLGDAQRQAVRSLFDAMKAETIPIGEQLIAQEAALDALFAGRTATAESVAALAAEIGGTQARLRAAHLRYHLSTLDLLQPAQVERYAELRGYRDGTADGQHHHGR